MICNSTARKLMYAWHSGQFSALYGPASSGLILVEDWEWVLKTVSQFSESEWPQSTLWLKQAMNDSAKLTEWLTVKRESFPVKMAGASEVYVLPWFDPKIAYQLKDKEK